MVKVFCYRVSSKHVHDFYEDKIPILPPSNTYTIFIVKIDNPEDKLFEYSEMILIKIGEKKYYPVLMLNVSIASKYCATMCDMVNEIEEMHKYDFIEKIPKNHIERLPFVLDKLL